MAQDTSSDIAYYLLIEKRNLDDIAALRAWANLKVAFDKDLVWVSNFDFVQIESVEVKSIPSKMVYYSKDAKLYPQNSLLPERNEPALLWTPIMRALPITISSYNHNYFGIEEEISIKIVPEEVEKQAEVMLLSLESLKVYAETAAEVRLQNLKWLVLDSKLALIFGRPILPIEAQVFWLNQDSILPVGHNFELPLLTEIIGNKLNPKKDSWIVWNSDTSYFKVNKDLMMPLSLSSVRKTINEIKNPKIPL